MSELREHIDGLIEAERQRIATQSKRKPTADEIVALVADRYRVPYATARAWVEAVFGPERVV